MSFTILFILIVFLFSRFEKAVCFSVAFYPILSLIRITDSINLFQAYSILVLAYFFINYRKKHQVMEKVSFPFTLTIFFVCISHVVTNLLQVPHWPTSFALIMSEYVMVYVFWMILQDNRNIHYFFSCFTIFMLIITGYCMIEFLLQDNPIYNWYVNSSLFMGYDADRSEDIRFGSMRCHSLMRDVGALGTACCFGFCVFFSYLQRTMRITKLKKYMLLGLIMLCFASTFLTGTRTVILGIAFCLLVCSLSLTYRNKVRLLTFVGVICILCSGFLYDIYMSFIDTKSVVGSSTDMRELQWAIVLQAFISSPIYGLGLEGTATIMNRFQGAFGLESTWFQLLVNFGALGAVAFAVSIIQGGKYSIKEKCIPAIAVTGMFMIVKTMSSIPGFGNGYFLYIIVYLVMFKKYTKYEKVKVGHINHA